MEDVLTLLYRLACEYGIEDEDMEELCVRCGVSFSELKKFEMKEGA